MKANLLQATSSLMNILINNACLFNVKHNTLKIKDCYKIKNKK